MFIKTGVVYTNFSGTKRVRVAGMFLEKGVSKIVVADLRPPGGKGVITRTEFEGEFAEEVAINGTVYAAVPSPEKVKRERKNRRNVTNPYDPRTQRSLDALENALDSVNELDKVGRG